MTFIAPRLVSDAIDLAERCVKALERIASALERPPQPRKRVDPFDESVGYDELY